MRSQSVQNIVQSLPPALKRDDVFNIRDHCYAETRARVTRDDNREDWVDNQGIFTSTIMTLLKLSIVFMVNIYRFISKGGLTL